MVRDLDKVPENDIVILNNAILFHRCVVLLT